MNSLNVFYSVMVHVTGPLAEEMQKHGFGYLVPIPDPVAVEPEPGCDIWENLNNVNLKPNKRQVVADIQIVVGNLDPNTSFHAVEVWGIAHELTQAKESRLFGSAQVALDVLETKDFDLVHAMLKKFMQELTSYPGASIDAHLRDAFRANARPDVTVYGKDAVVLPGEKRGAPFPANPHYRR